MVERPLPPVTLREVARAAGVSTASASRALARHGAVSADLRQRIRAAADRLGYTPNLAARSLAARRSGLVGVMVGDLGEALISDALAALECRLAAAGYGVVMVGTRESPGRARSALRELLSRSAEALVLAEPAHGQELAAELRACALPWIAIAEDLAGGAFAVDAGRRRGAELAGRYLLDLGHRRIAVIAPTAGTAAGLADALTGSNRAPLAAATLAPDADAAQAALRLLMSQADPPTAVICGSDLYALAVVRACLGQGIAVPHAISIIGFGDAEFARRAVPALTTLRIPAAALGVALAEGLLAHLEGRGQPPACAAPVKLVVRESTGPAPR
jgi:LacI family transcriptional regulator